jgi:hypothetical protein
VLHDSYAPESVFLPLRHARRTHVHDAFARALNYDENEAIFILCRLDLRNIFRYIVASAAFAVSNRLRQKQPVRSLLASWLRAEARITYHAEAELSHGLSGDASTASKGRGEFLPGELEQAVGWPRPVGDGIVQLRKFD